MKHVTARQLDVLFSMAKDELVNTGAKGLDDHQNLARCWLVCVSRFLDLPVEFKFPFREFVEPDEE